ncbi:MAG: Holliday junction resolvase RuvX [Flavobacteriales bacterium]|nr:Holliday junction resolvase RuvX [Flavobacteriales bacterium]
MSRVIAIDLGLKRTGIAVTDPLRIIASALETVETTKVMDYLSNYLAREAVDGFIVGLPVGLDGRPTDATAAVQDFIARLRAAFPAQWVEPVDERFTSRMAARTVQESGKGRMARRDKGQLDRISATILLQDWLQRQG